VLSEYPTGLTDTVLLSILELMVFVIIQIIEWIDALITIYSVGKNIY
jgi:hypothetical protein